MPRPRIGKVPHWDTISPSEQKVIDKQAERWLVVKFADMWGGVTPFEPKFPYVTKAFKDSALIRDSVARHHNAKIVMEKLSEADARMWANIMQ